MKHGSRKHSKRLLFTSVLAIVVILAVGFYLIGNANSNKDESNSDNSTSVTMSHISRSTNQQESKYSTTSNSQQESKYSTTSNSQQEVSQSSSQSSTNNNSLIYYNGQTKVKLPTTDGTIDPQENWPNGASFWTATLTIDGKKENVVATYARQGYFAIFTKEPTNKPQGFTYNGDYLSHIGDKDLDPLASSSKTVRY
ncbi:unnamed protein product [Fructobacillus tropaeoli]|uniref:Secreted protein n=2 Tax=Fructobacillus tropaeoli TaxID=709323 RepID=A0ABN9YRX4_9LACO|nr:unnamed protein product [Fructobacillus tropaeoli]